uniref:Aldehyde dehydrogenase n=1 Tax=Neogobius melanostomus TaxID=47308 RepID=A0A8C6SNZ9_9GOBI
MSREQQAVAQARKAFETGRSKSLDYRIFQLQNLTGNILSKEKVQEVNLAIKNLKSWAAPRPVEKNLLTIADTVYIRPEPLGVVLIIGPLIGAIAAGNSFALLVFVLFINRVAQLNLYVCIIIPFLFLFKELYTVVTGGVAETQELLRQRFDHIFYTGNSMVGKIIMEAAAKHLTPVTLELGGKSPCYIDKNCDITIARIAWGKYTNCGQTCIAPDYILCETSIQDRVIAEIKKAVQEFYTDNPQTCPDYGRIINQRHYKRIMALLDDSTVAMGGQNEEADRYLAPTVLRDVKPEAKVMQEEIFGPVLPIITVSGLDEAIKFINKGENLWLFTSSHQMTRFGATSSGAILANDCLVHYSVSALPFGGVGNSGMGSYHGKFTFDQLSHQRSCLIKKLKMEGVNTMRYPPHTPTKLSRARFFILKCANLGWIGLSIQINNNCHMKQLLSFPTVECCFIN